MPTSPFFRKIPKSICHLCCCPVDSNQCADGPESGSVAALFWTEPPLRFVYRHVVFLLLSAGIFSLFVFALLGALWCLQGGNCHNEKINDSRWHNFLKKETLLWVLPSLLVCHSFNQTQKIFQECNLLLESLKISADLQSLIFYRLLFHKPDSNAHKTSLSVYWFAFSSVKWW